MGNESTFSARLRDELELRGFVCYCIESAGTCLGVPDLHFIHTGTGTTGWIELKFARTFPKRVTYQRGQSSWLEIYTSFGGTAMTLMYVEDEKKVYIIHGAYSSCAEESAKDCPMLSFSVKDKQCWLKIADALLHSEELKPILAYRPVSV